MGAILDIDILCKVVDNYGDIGFAYRLARSLSERPDAPRLRLVVDDFDAFALLDPAVDPSLAQQVVHGWELYRWRESGAGEATASFRARRPRIVLECFACGRPDWLEAILFEPGTEESGHRSDGFPGRSFAMLLRFSFPRMLLVRQNFPDRRIADVAGEVRRQLAASPFASQLRPGARVAVGVGSRGINDIATIVRAAVDYWKQNGMHPFIIPAMGSHGAATAEGQAAVLAHYGIHEANHGVPLHRQWKWRPIGRLRTTSKPSWISPPTRAMASCWLTAPSGTPISGQAGERPVQDDGNRTGKIRRRREVPYVRRQDGAGTSDSQRGPPGAEVGQDARGTGHPGGRQSRHRAAVCGWGAEEMERREQKCWRW